MNHSEDKIEHTQHSSVRRFLTIAVIILGILLVVGTILDLGAFTIFTQNEADSERLEKFIQTIFYSALGFVCLILGLERALDMTKIDKTLAHQNKVLGSIDRHISQYRQYKLLNTYQEIFDYSINLIRECNAHVRTVVYASSPKAPDNWHNEVADILLYKAKSGKPIQYEIVFCVNPEDLTPQFFEAAEKRLECYRTNGVMNYVHFYFQFMEKTIGTDCIIIDDKHLMVTFPTILSNMTQRGFLFENQREAVTDYLNWYISYAKFEAISMKTARKQFLKHAAEI